MNHFYSIKVRLDFGLTSYERKWSPFEQVFDSVKSAEESRKLVEWGSNQV